MDKCSNCGTELGTFRYNPKKDWQITGQLCKTCWDEHYEVISGHRTYKLEQSTKFARSKWVYVIFGSMLLFGLITSLLR